MSGPLTVLNGSDMAYTGWASNYAYGTPTVSTSNSPSGITNNIPGYNPVNYQNKLSNFTIYNTGATTQYYASFIIQQQLSATTSNPPTTTNAPFQVANNVLSVPVYSLTSAVDSASNILYYSVTADLLLNTPTNPSSSVYNIFLNLNLFDANSGLQGSSSTPISTSIPYFLNYTYGSSDPVCDVLLTLSSMGSTSVSPIFTLTSQDISANSPSSGSTSTANYEPVSDNNVAVSASTLFTLNIPVSSVFPQISQPGILYRLKVELLGYY
jgi:hypothetical protein